MNSDYNAIDKMIGLSLTEEDTRRTTRFELSSYQRKTQYYYGLPGC